MRKILAGLALALSVIVSSPHYALAHTLKSDGTVGAVLHISPDDDPVVGKQSELVFELQDSANKFEMAMCLCTLSIEQGGERIFTEQLSNTRESLQSVAYSFPEKGVYTIIIEGSSHHKTFPSFKLSYDIRVEKESAGNSSQATSTWSIYSLVIGIPLLIIGLLWLLQRKFGNKPKLPLAVLVIGLILGSSLISFKHLVVTYEQTHTHHATISLDHPCCAAFEPIIFKFSVLGVPKIEYCIPDTSIPECPKVKTIGQLRDKSPPLT